MQISNNQRHAAISAEQVVALVKNDRTLREEISNEVKHQYGESAMPNECAERRGIGPGQQVEWLTKDPKHDSYVGSRIAFCFFFSFSWFKSLLLSRSPSLIVLPCSSSFSWGTGG